MDKNTTDLPDGIYFGLPEDDYHALPRLSASGIKTMCVSPLDFWMSSWLNPEREEDEDTAAKKLGRAYHKLLLEGDAAFDASYAVAPSKDDYPDAIDGAEALKAKCDEIGLKKTGRISDLCERIREADPAVQLWPDIMMEFSNSAHGKETLTKKQWQEIQRVRFVLNHMPDVNTAFTGGFPEVSILWTENGVRMKVRADYLKARGKQAAILDVKSFGNVMSKPIEEVPAGEISRNRYFIQPVAYVTARKAISRLWYKKGREIVHVVNGPEPDDAWLDAVLSPDRQQFHFVFVQTGGIPNIIVREFAEGYDFGGLSFQANEYWRRGAAEFRYGVQLFRKCLAEYGPDVPWIANYGVRALRDDEFPMWALTSPTPFLDDEAAE